MQIHRLHQKLSALLAAACAAAAGCGPQPLFPNGVDPARSTCPSGMAQLEVSDAYLRILCGCNEAAGTPVGPPATLTCTIPAGGSVTFLFTGQHLHHQIIPSDPASALRPSPVADPMAVSPVRVHVVTLTAAGTYPFSDAYNRGLSGSVVAQ